MGSVNVAWFTLSEIAHALVHTAGNEAVTSHLWSGTGNYSSLKLCPCKLSVATIHTGCHYKVPQTRVATHVSAERKIRDA